jgi:GNAT superfamily N-acetyltransferase
MALIVQPRDRPRRPQSGGGNLLRAGVATYNGAMLFASEELAARIERAECRLLSDSVEAVQRESPGRDAFAISLAGGVATFLGADAPATKVAGLGFAGGPDEGALADVERAFLQRGAAVQVELSSLGAPAIGAMLTRRGYELRGIENISGLSLTSAAPWDGGTNRAAIEVVPSGADELATWTEIVIEAFAAPDTQGTPSHESFAHETLERAIRDMAGATGLTRYLARVDGEAIGAASMKLCEGIAQLCGAATLPAYRRRGAQAAMLHARLEAARRSACDIATVTTLPGSKSQQNVQRWGFELLYTRAILVRPAAI